jgi:hypothetical protein
MRFRVRGYSLYESWGFICGLTIRTGGRNWVLRVNGCLVGRFSRLKDARAAADVAWVDTVLDHLQDHHPAAFLPPALRYVLLDAIRGDRLARGAVHDLLEEHVNRNDEYVERDLRRMSSRPSGNCPPVLGTEEITEERVARLKAHAEKMRRLATTAQERADEALRVYERFAEILADRAGKSRDDSAEEE